MGMPKGKRLICCAWWQYRSEAPLSPFSEGNSAKCCMVNQSEEEQWLVQEDDGPIGNMGPIE